MYKEIHPFWFDSSAFATNRTQQSKEYYKPCEPRIIRLEDIRQIVKESVPDGSIELRRLCVSDDYHSDIIISEKEAAEIQANLLKPAQDNSLAAEVRILSSVIRNLYDLLRARLH